MIKYLFPLFFTLFLSVGIFAQQQTVTYTVNPATFNETQSVTITVNGSSVNESTWGVTNNSLYIWAWSYDHATNTSQDCPTNGTWTASNASNKFTYNAGTDTYTFTFVPTTFFNRTGLSKMGFLVKALDATGDKKSQDIYVNISALQFLTTTPAKNSVNFVAAGSSNSISYTTSVAANWTLTANGSPVHTVLNSASFSYNYVVNGDANMVLTATNATDNSQVISLLTLLYLLSQDYILDHL